MSSLGPILNEFGERIAFDFTAPANGAFEHASIVVIGHGLTSDKDRPWSRALSDALANKGVSSLRIAFSGNGESEGRFEDSTITKELGDLEAVMVHLRERFPAAATAYIGQSMGGAVGLLHAAHGASLRAEDGASLRAEDRASLRAAHGASLRAAHGASLRALVSLAPLTHTAEFAERMFGHLNYGDVMLEKPHCRWNSALADDLRRIHSVVSAAREVSVPWRIVHGTADDVTPIEYSRELCAEAPPGTELIELAGVDHSFSGQGIGLLVQAVVPWLVPRLED